MAKRLRTVLALFLALAGGCRTTLPPADPAFVSEWMQNYYGLVRAERLSPPVASRVLAYAAVGLYEGYAAAAPELPSLAGRLNGLDSLPRPARGERVDPVLTAVAAERTVLDSLFVEGLPATRAALAELADSLEQARLAAGVPGDYVAPSRALGQRIGARILAWAASDGFDSTRAKPYLPPAGKDEYWINDSPVDEYTSQSLNPASEFVQLENPAASLQPGAASERALAVNRPKAKDIRTLKAVNPVGATEPWWGTLRPFVLRTADECGPVPPPAYSTDPASDWYREAARTLEVSRTLTEEQRQTVLYWADNAGQTGTPVGHWLGIGSQLVSQLGLSTEQALEVFALATVAQADAFIAVWRAKYAFNTVRPRTYIRRTMDPAWEPVIATPPFPSYPSGHAGQSAAAAGVLTGLLGTVAFEDSTNLTLGHPVRRYPSFRAAADEAALSRLLGGLHYDVDNVESQRLGQCIGEKVLERLRPSGGK
jgi:hypothetical protein